MSILPHGNVHRFPFPHATGPSLHVGAAVEHSLPLGLELTFHGDAALFQGFRRRFHRGVPGGRANRRLWDRRRQVLQLRQRRLGLWRKRARGSHLDDHLPHVAGELRDVGARRRGNLRARPFRLSGLLAGRRPICLCAATRCRRLRRDGRWRGYDHVGSCGRLHSGTDVRGRNPGWTRRVETAVGRQIRRGGRRGSGRDEVQARYERPGITECRGHLLAETLGGGWIGRLPVMGLGSRGDAIEAIAQGRGGQFHPLAHVRCNRRFLGLDRASKRGD